MKQSLRFMLGGALLLSLPMFLTSCEDILGEWSKPTPVNVIVTPDDGGTEDHSNQYIKYTSATDSSYVNIEGATEWTGTVTPGDVAAGTYVVSGTATCAGQLVLKGEVNIILKDGAKLTVDDGITYDITGDIGSLNIYAQGISSSMGQLIVNNNTPVDFGGGTEASAIVAKGLSIHGGKVNATADTGGTAADLGGKGLEISGNIYIYNGLITATATQSQMGIIYSAAANGSINILGGEVYAYSPGGQGISTSNIGDILNISGGKVTAKDTSKGGEGINCDIINITGGTVIAENGPGGNAAIQCTSTLTISGADTKVTATGGDGNSTLLDAGYGITGTVNIDGGDVTVSGGNGAKGTATSKDGGYGGAGISGNVKVSGTATVKVTGGRGGDGYDADGGNGGPGGNGIFGSLDNASPNVTVTGGNGGDAGTRVTSGTNTGGSGANAISGAKTGTAATTTNGTYGSSDAVL